MTISAKSLLEIIKQKSHYFKLLEHTQICTIEEHKAALSEFKYNGIFVKNLFLKGKKTGKFYLISALPETKIDLNGLAKYLQEGNSGLRNAPEESLNTILNCYRGCVSPLGLMNDTDNQVLFYVDQNLDLEKNILVHPMQSDLTLEMKAHTIFELTGRKYTIIDFEKLENTGVKEEAKAKEPKESKEKKKGKDKVKPTTEADEEEGELIGITVKREEHFPDWYQQVIKKAEMLDFYTVSGCYILRPASYHIWEKIQHFLDTSFKSEGVQNCYFPMFVSKAALEKEKSHLEGFSAEVAWVTRSGKNDLAEPIAIRPTSETIMYPAYAKWIKSHRDLPLKLNQWTNIVRWEFKHPTPFLRTREFLWQEGHTAHETSEEAAKTVRTMLGHYQDCYTKMLAVPTIRGRKSENEKFAGAFYTESIEGYIRGPNRAIQAATSHHLGQNFSKMFEIQFLDKSNKSEFAHQTSWGFTTRSIGIAIMTHSDNKGLVCPPWVSQYQVTIVPIFQKNNTQEVHQYASSVYDTFKTHGYRVIYDDRDNYKPGWKYSHWELKGVPMRVEVGPKDIKTGSITVVLRDNGEKFSVQVDEHLAEKIEASFNQMHERMYQNALDKFRSSVKVARKWADFMEHLNAGNMVMAPFCNDPDAEELLKDKSKEESKEDTVQGQTGSAKSLNFPLDEELTMLNLGVKNGTEMDCITNELTGKNNKSKEWCLFGRSY